MECIKDSGTGCIGNYGNRKDQNNKHVFYIYHKSTSMYVVELTIIQYKYVVFKIILFINYLQMITMSPSI